jgi:hypothetical protein
MFGFAQLVNKLQPGRAMRQLLLLLVSGAAGLTIPTLVHAQLPPPPGGPWPTYNYERAYRHFQNSPYAYRSFSSLGTGSAGQTWTPFGVQGYYIDPRYENQRITPHGYERYTAIPGYGGYTATPFGYTSYYIPGYGYQYYSPLPPRSIVPQPQR